MKKIYSEYRECKKEYIEFLENLCELIKNNNLKDPVEIYMFYKMLIDKGYLSKNNSFFHKLNFIENDLKKLNGAKVISGKYNGKSQNEFLVDIETLCGNSSAILPIYDKIKPNYDTGNSNHKYDDIVVSFNAENSEIIGYSPKDDSFYSLMTTYSSIVAYKDIEHKNLKDNRQVFYASSKYCEYDNTSLMFFNEYLKTRTITSDEIEYIKNKIESLDSRELDLFFKSNLELIVQIVNSVNQISSVLSLNKVKRLCMPRTSYN